MHPILFEIGRFPVYTYGVLLAAAYLLGLQFALVRARARGLDPNRVMDLGIWIIISALVGAKLLLLVVEFDTFGSNPAELLTLLRSGGVFYGGLIAAVVVALWYLWRHRMPLWTVTDVFAPGIALGHVIGRMGCFFAGCCFGTADDGAVGDHLPQRVRGAERRHAARRPAAPDAALRSGRRAADLGLLLATERRGRPFPGRTFWSYMLLYAVSRFIIEFYRGDPRGHGRRCSRRRSSSRILIVPLAIVMLVVLATPDRSRRRSAPARAGAGRVMDGRRASAAAAVVEPEHDGMRLDNFLTALLPDQSRSQHPAADQGRTGHRPGRRRSAPSTPVHAGQAFVVDVPAPTAADAGAGGAAAPHRLPGRGPRRARQAGRDGRASGARATAAARWSTRCCTTSRI